MKRRIAIVSLLVLLGAILNVAVAWTYARWAGSPLHFTVRPPSEDDLTWWNRDGGDSSKNALGAVAWHEDRSCAVRIGISHGGGRVRAEDDWIVFDFGSSVESHTVIADELYLDLQGNMAPVRSRSLIGRSSEGDETSAASQSPPARTGNADDGGRGGDRCADADRLAALH